MCGKKGIYLTSETLCEPLPRNGFDKHNYYDQVGLTSEFDRCILNRFSTFHFVPMDIRALPQSPVSEV